MEGGRGGGGALCSGHVNVEATERELHESGESCYGPAPAPLMCPPDRPPALQYQVAKLRGGACGGGGGAEDHDSPVR